MTPCNTSLVVLDLKVRIYSSYFTLQSLDTYVISKNIKAVKWSDFVIFLLSIAYFLDMRYCPQVRGQDGWIYFSCFYKKRKEGSRPICSHLTIP